MTKADWLKLYSYIDTASIESVVSVLDILHKIFDRRLSETDKKCLRDIGERNILNFFNNQPLDRSYVMVDAIIMVLANRKNASNKPC
jgi:hypothetical protein